MLSLSPYELNYFLESNYQIFLSPITKLKDNLSSLIHIFQLDDSDTTGIILSCPQLLTIPKSNLYSFTQTIMRTFSYPNPELDRILFTTPSLATYDNAKLLHQCKMLSSCNIFVKRDLKEILLSSPTILSLTQDELISNILNLARLFKLSSEKQILEFVRLCPRAIAVRDIYRKLKLLDEYSIKLAHIVYSPSILKSQTILSAIKFLILKSVHQEYCIDSIIDMSIDELVSKLKFLHNINSSVNDISLCNELFENKYHITTSKLLKKYKTSPHELKQLFVAAFGNNLKFNKFKTFFDTNYTEQMRIALSKIQCNSNTLKNKKSIAKILQILGIDIWDCESIANLLYKNVIAQRVLENIELLKKHEIPRDHIIEIITKKPILLASSTKRLNDKLNNLKNDYSYNIIKFYENI